MQVGNKMMKLNTKKSILSESPANMLALILSENASEYNKYKLLNEDDKSTITKAFANFIFKKGGELINEKGFDSIKKSEGDITSMEEYSNLLDSVLTFNKLKSNSALLNKKLNQAPKNYINEVSIVLNYLSDKKNIAKFKSAFVHDNEVVKLTYFAMVTTLYHAVALIIAEFVYVIKSTNKATKPSISLSEYPREIKNINHPTFGLIEEYSNAIVGGKMDQMLKIADESGKVLTESVLVLTGLVLGGILGLILFIRTFVAGFFTLSAKASDWFDTQATFMKLNATRIQESNPEAAAKQLKYAERLDSLSKKVSLTAVKNKEEYNTNMNTTFKAKEMVQPELSNALI